MEAEGSRHDLVGITLDRAEGALYRQLAGRLRGAIASGRLPVGGELATEAELAQAFGVSLITVRHALRELQTEGLIQYLLVDMFAKACTGQLTPRDAVAWAEKEYEQIAKKRRS